jgi:predicted DNA-binding WGR domain protein
VKPGKKGRTAMREFDDLAKAIMKAIDVVAERKAAEMVNKYHASKSPPAIGGDTDKARRAVESALDDAFGKLIKSR